MEKKLVKIMFQYSDGSIKATTDTDNFEKNLSNDCGISHLPVL